MSEIKGYNKLTQEQVDAMNLLKDDEARLLSTLKLMCDGNAPFSVDKRWLAIARTNFEQGYMAACRAIAQPATVEF